MQQVETAATQARAAGFDHGERRRHGHGSVEGIATRRENLLPRLARQGIGAGNGRFVSDRRAPLSRGMCRWFRVLYGRGLVGASTRRYRTGSEEGRENRSEKSGGGPPWEAQE